MPGFLGAPGLSCGVVEEAVGLTLERTEFGTSGLDSRDNGRHSLRKLAIVPAYNEAGSVGQVVSEIKRQAPGFDVLVVDDGSTDATALEAEAAGASLLIHPFNL